MDKHELVPQHFICPISLQTMKDPVTTISGITYDRDSIEHWLFETKNTVCPVTRQPLSKNTTLTPNHTLLRLIQVWSTPNEPSALNLSNSKLNLETLQNLENLSAENSRIRDYMVEAGLGKKLFSYIISCYRSNELNGLKQALTILYHIRVQLGQIITENDEMVNSLIWVFGFDDNKLKSHAVYAIKMLIQKPNHGIIQRLKPDFFQVILNHLRSLCDQETNSVLQVLLEASQYGTNRVSAVGSGAVCDLIEVELRRQDKKTTELVLGILCNLCCCADGRAEVVGHPAGIAVVTQRVLKVSAAADDRAVMIIWLICKYSGTNGVVQEMLTVGTVAKLCMVVQADTASYLKEKVSRILRKYYHVWKDSPCVDVASLTRHTR